MIDDKESAVADSPERKKVSVHLEPILPERDAPAIHALLNDDPEHISSLDFGTNDFSSVQAVQRFLESHPGGLNILTGDGIVGNVYVSSRPDKDTAAIGYWVVKRAAGQGIGTEAVRQASDYAFRELHKGAVLAGVEASNEASRALLRRVGFDLLKQEMVEGVSQDPVDICTYVLLNPELSQPDQDT